MLRIGSVLLAALLMGSLSGRVEAQKTSKPPVAPVKPVVDDYFGTKVTDPYRYMENLQDPTVITWMKGQNAYTRNVLAGIQGREGLLARVRELDASAPAKLRGLRRLENGDYFYLKSLSSDTIYKLYMRDGPNGAETLLVDPESRAGGPPRAINYFAPSDDGRYVVYGISEGGSEQAVLHVLDTQTQRETGEAIDRADFGYEIGWLPDGHAFTYNRLQKLPPGAPMDERQLNSRIFLHKVGSNAEKDVSVFGYQVSPRVKMDISDVPFVAISPGVPYAFGIVQHGARSEVTMYAVPLSALGKTDAPWVKLFDLEDEVIDAAVRGDDVWMLSHKDADRYKVLHTSLSKPDVKQAQVVVAESQAVITDIQEAEDSLYVQMRDGAVDRLYRLGYEAGAKLEPVALPEEGSIQMYESDPRLPGIVFSVTGWTKAARIFQYDPKENSVTDTKLRPVGRFDAPADLEAEEVKVPAKDGTLIPVSIIHKRGIKLDGSNPTLMEGYGGYGISLDPFFDPIFLAWYEQGGIYAVAHVRGGGEYGEGWHLAGQKLTKPNTWNDFIACGEYLVAKGYTSTPKLAGWGVSAGGILIGRAITARPDLFGAAIIEVGFTDTLRGEFEQNGPGEISEWGTVKEPEGFKALYEMSAYAHVTNGTSYPATLLITGSNDPRVWPAEPAKMTARLQAATSSGKPVLLRVDYEAGHGIGSTKKQQEERLGDTFAFLLWQLGVAGFEPKAAPSTARAQ